MLRRNENGAEAIPRASLVEDAYAALKTAIRENAYPPGHQISEQEIAAQLNMSRTPVHEALIRLQAEGLVRILPRRGVVVSSVSPDDIREIYDVTIALESMAAELLAKKPDEERRAVANDLILTTKDMEARLAADDLAGWAKADDRFHRLLVERCGNGRLTRLLETVQDQSHRARVMTLRLRPKPIGSASQHMEIVEAIRRGDPPAARDAAYRHRAGARDQIVPLLNEYGMRHL